MFTPVIEDHSAHWPSALLRATALIHTWTSAASHFLAMAERQTELGLSLFTVLLFVSVAPYLVPGRPVLHPLSRLVFGPLAPLSHPPHCNCRHGASLQCCGSIQRCPPGQAVWPPPGCADLGWLHHFISRDMGVGSCSLLPLGPPGFWPGHIHIDHQPLCDQGPHGH